MSSLTGYNPSSTISTAFSSGNYRHIALSISGTIHTLYLDGSAVAVNSNAGDIFSIYNSAIQDLYIGCAGDLSYGYTGTIDDFKIWNRALPIADINNILYTGFGVDFKGGDYQVTAGEYTYIVFINSGSVVFSKNYNVEYLIIGGGASGWCSYGGGGGAGQCLSGNFVVDAFTPYPVVRGDAGTTTFVNKTGVLLLVLPLSNLSGNPSSVFGFTARGGGHGGGLNYSSTVSSTNPSSIRTVSTGVTGGSGGGGGANRDGFPTYIVITAGGSNGDGTNTGGAGRLITSDIGSGGGGGGAGQVGGTSNIIYPGNSYYYGGKGGNGTNAHSQWLIDISSVMPNNWKIATSSGYIAGGGGGSTYIMSTVTPYTSNNTPTYPIQFYARGGLGGGGNGSWEYHGGTNLDISGNGVNYTGSGAGSGLDLGTRVNSGGHGLVVLRFKTAS
jgi:hypothetical protein